MIPLKIPHNYNYIGAFLTLSCNYRCSYCLNRFGALKTNHKLLSGEEWVSGLNRIICPENIPVTLQGGEPSLHKDFIYILNNLKPKLKIDILTNLQFDVDEFIKKVSPKRLKRSASYASIRISFHPEVMDLNDTIHKTLKMLNSGFNVGVWGILHPSYEEVILRAREICQSRGIDFRTKEFLGNYNGRLYGTYKYEGACDYKNAGNVKCKTTELLIGPEGSIYRCHSDLYEKRSAIGHIIENKLVIADEDRQCIFFGRCNPCDVKIKTNRFQKYGHTSVEIKSIPKTNRHDSA